jgi:hypothetical protein
VHKRKFEWQSNEETPNDSRANGVETETGVSVFGVWEKLRPAFAFFAMRQLMKVKQGGKWRHALPARFQPDDLGKARRVNDDQEPTSHITRPAQFHPGHIRFAGEIAPESAIICISLKFTKAKFGNR